MSLGGHARQTPDKGIHVSISWTFADSAARAAFIPTSGIPALEAQLTSADLGKFAWDLDTDGVFLLKSLSPITWVPVGGVLASTALLAGAGLDGGGDLTGNVSFDVIANADGSIVVNPDDIQVGVLATDAQHGSRGGGALHAVATTSTAGFMSVADKGLLGRVGVISSFSTGTSSTSGSTPITKTSIVIPAEDETFIIEASALVSMSNGAANGAMRLQNITSDTTLSTRVFDTSMSGTASSTIRVEAIQTIGAGAQTVAIQYYIASGAGTVAVSDALITARRKI